MTKTEAKPAIVAVNELFAKSADGLREIVRTVMQEMLEAEMTDALAPGTTAVAWTPVPPRRLLQGRHPPKCDLRGRDLALARDREQIRRLPEPGFKPRVGLLLGGNP